MNKKRSTTKEAYQDRRGAALYLSLIILTGIFVSAMGIADMVISGIRMGGVQTRSTQAYFASESGVEKVLWEYRKNNYSEPASSTEDVFSDTLDNGSEYQVDYIREEEPAEEDELPDSWVYKKFISVGSYKDVRRSVQAMLKYPQYE